MFVHPDEFISLLVLGSLDLFLSVPLVISESDAPTQDSVIFCKHGGFGLGLQQQLSSLPPPRKRACTTTNKFDQSPHAFVHRT